MIKIDIIAKYGESIYFSDIEKVEKKIQYKFPEDYKLFLLDYNCVIPEKGIFLINKQQGEDSFDIFYGINISKKSRNIVDIYEENKSDFPSGFIPIGEDPGGSYICMNLNDTPNFGHIYFQDNEAHHDDEDGNVTWANMYKVANSFTEFVEGLK